MIKAGTHHFVNRAHIVKLYGKENAQNKIAADEVVIGKPELKAGQSLWIIKSEGRYQIGSAS